MKVTKEDIINKIESLAGFIEYENKFKIDKKFYKDLCEEVAEFIIELKENKIEFVN